MHDTMQLNVAFSIHMYMYLVDMKNKTDVNYIFFYFYSIFIHTVICPSITIKLLNPSFSSRRLNLQRNQLPLLLFQAKENIYIIPKHIKNLKTSENVLYSSHFGVVVDLKVNLLCQQQYTIT